MIVLKEFQDQFSMSVLVISRSGRLWYLLHAEDRKLGFSLVGSSAPLTTALTRDGFHVPLGWSLIINPLDPEVSVL